MSIGANPDLAAAAAQGNNTPDLILVIDYNS